MLSCSYTLCIRLITCQSLLLPNTFTHPLESHPFPLSLLYSFVITLLFSTSFLPIHCVKPSFGTPSSESNLPMILSRTLKTTRCSSFIWLFLVKSLAFAIRDIFLSPSGVSSSSYNSFIAHTLAVLVLSLPPCLLGCSYLCLPDVSHIFRASFLAFITSCALSFHHQVSLSHGDLRPAVMLNTSCSTLKIVLLLSSHHSCTLSTGLTFSNTVSLHFIFGVSSFNLHQFILWIACSGFQRFLPYLPLLMCQFSSPPTITLSSSSVALSS